MNSIDIVNKLAADNNISNGRAEMIMNIIMEKIVDTLKREGKVSVEDFGEFSFERKQNIQVYDANAADTSIKIFFKPDQKFLDVINS